LHRLAPRCFSQRLPDERLHAQHVSPIRVRPLPSSLCSAMPPAAIINRCSVNREGMTGTSSCASATASRSASGLRGRPRWSGRSLGGDPGDRR
jgi:hypothetical protein